MSRLRAFFLKHSWLVAMLVALALAMKLLIPAGFMLGQSGARTLTVLICADSPGHAVTKQIIVARSGARSGPGDNGKQVAADGACPFTALGHGLIGGADPVQLALALLFILALAFAPLVPARARPVLHLRPPLRGPPALA